MFQEIKLIDDCGGKICNLFISTRLKLFANNIVFSSVITNSNEVKEEKDYISSLHSSFLSLITD